MRLVLEELDMLVNGFLNKDADDQEPLREGDKLDDFVEGGSRIVAPQRAQATWVCMVVPGIEGGESSSRRVEVDIGSTVS